MKYWNKTTYAFYISITLVYSDKFEFRSGPDRADKVKSFVCEFAGSGNLALGKRVYTEAHQSIGIVSTLSLFYIYRACTIMWMLWHISAPVGLSPLGKPYEADVGSVTDANWGESESTDTTCLPGNGWRLDGVQTGKKWLAIFLESDYYVQRIVYMGPISDSPATKVMLSP